MGVFVLFSRCLGLEGILSYVDFLFGRWISITGGISFVSPAALFLLLSSFSLILGAESCDI